MITFATATVSVLILSLVYLGTIAAFVVVRALRRGGRRDDPAAGGEALALSRFTIPVSVIVPLGTDQANPRSVSTMIRNLLALSYPEFEVIVVADGLSADAVQTLADEWQAAPREFFYRDSLDTAAVQRIFRGADDERLMIVEKAAGGRADAVNCGVNLARYRYVAVITPDVTFAPDSLIRSMTPALADPAHVVAAVSHVERRRTGEEPTAWERLTASVQRLSSVRAMMESRVVPADWLSGPCLRDSVMVWRRDAFLAARGLDAFAADADLDLMLRMTLASRTARIARTDEVFGFATALRPDALFAVRERRQAAIMRVAGRWMRRPGERFAYFIGIELFVPLAQLCVVCSAVGAMLVGALSGWEGLAAVLILALGSAAISNAALLVRGASADAPDTLELKALIAAGPLETLLVRPLLALARIRGACSAVV